jgi:hypothetical protein
VVTAVGVEADVEVEVVLFVVDSLDVLAAESLDFAAAEDEFEDTAWWRWCVEADVFAATSATLVDALEVE